MAHGERPSGCPPHIDAVEWNGEPWPSDKPFPLTPEEAWWAMRGYAIIPASGPLDVETYRRMVYRRWELIEGRLSPSN